MKHLKLQFKIIPLEDAVVHTHWSDHLNQRVQTAKSCSLTHTLAEHTFTWWISLGWTEAPETSIWNKFRVACTMFHSEIHTRPEYKLTLPKNTHTHKKKGFVFFLSQITKSSQRFSELGQLKLWNSKSSEVSRDVLGYLLACMYQPDDPPACHYYKK